MSPCRWSRRRYGTIRCGRSKNDGEDFSATQASVFLDGFTFRRFVEACYAENVRRMADFQSDLLRPRFLPALAGAALSGLRLFPVRTPRGPMKAVPILRLNSGLGGRPPAPANAAFATAGATFRGSGPSEASAGAWVTQSADCGGAPA